jgi:hypothetical protein
LYTSFLLHREMMLIHGLDTLAGVDDESVTAASIRQDHTLTYTSYLRDLDVDSLMH